MATDTATVAPPAEVSDAPNPWKHTIIACGAKIKASVKDAKVIVVQSRTRVAPQRLEEGEARQSHFEARGYPVGDTYLRFEPLIDFAAPAGAEVLEMGATLIQHGFAGLSAVPGEVCVGPAHPAYAAMDLAKQRGAQEITFDGLDPEERKKLTPWLLQVKDQFAQINFT